MSYISVKIHKWEEHRKAESNMPHNVGDVIIVQIDEVLESAIVDGLSFTERENSENLPVAKVLRKANLRDVDIIREHRKKAQEALEYCHGEIKKSNLPMKVVAASYSFDGGSITFAFIADGRVDFRDLVKNLSKQFQRSVRLHQIGARDEARQQGGYGICGRQLCCITFKGDLPSISSEMAKVQQILHRGSERISGLCGRLMCCLAYEADFYRNKIKEEGEKAEIKKK
jgi:cell fate regulator YaaT (PSP1 superfamily)